MKLRPNFIRRASGSMVDLALGLGGRRVGVRRAAEAPAILHHAAGAVGLVVTVCSLLTPPVLDEAAVPDLKPVFPVPRNRLWVGGPLGLEALLGLPKPGPPAAASAQMLGQLVAPCLAEALALGGVDLGRLG
jgi:hypothetical protein